MVVAVAPVAVVLTIDVHAVVVRIIDGDQEVEVRTVADDPSVGVTLVVAHRKSKLTKTSENTV